MSFHSALDDTNFVRFWRDNEGEGAFHAVSGLIRRKPEVESLEEIGEEQEGLHLSQLLSETFTSTLVERRNDGRKETTIVQSEQNMQPMSFVFKWKINK